MTVNIPIWDLIIMMTLAGIFVIGMLYAVYERFFK